MIATVVFESPGMAQREYERAPVSASGALAGSRLRRAGHWVAHNRARLLASLALAAIACGGILHLLGEGAAGDAVWRFSVALLAVELAYEVARTILVEGHLGVDSIALVAMVGALALGEELAGAVVGLMFSGGEALEAAASQRARRELTALVKRAPTVTSLRVGDSYERVPVERVHSGDVVLVRAGEVIPVDGAVIGGEAVVDSSALTGEPLPKTLGEGMPVLSGAANAGGPFEVRATRPASESAYAALVRLVREAEGRRAPFVRMADRYAGVFLPVTLAMAGAAWALSGEAIRALAVVVVATPCPLILAAPIAFVSGLSRAARAGVVVKGAAAIETLGEARTVLFDKTGTLTIGQPRIREILPARSGSEGRDSELLRLAASVDRMSAHVLGEALVAAAEEAQLSLATATEIREEPGQGIAGRVEGRTVAVGSRSFLRAAGCPAQEIADAGLSTVNGSGEARVYVSIDGRLAGAIVMADDPRPDADRIVEALREEGVRLVAMVSGDRRSVAERVGGELAMDRVYAEQSPEEKLEVVRGLSSDPRLGPVIMVGDGVNDAPALAEADLGIAMGVAGATVSSETADAVITVDRIDRVIDAVHCGRRALRIARQSVLVGMGLSLAAMLVAAAGYLPPVAGALLQEGIDLAVILNALRALQG